MSGVCARVCACACVLNERDERVVDEWLTDSAGRVSLAFVVDIAVFSCWQAYLIGQLDPEASPACRFVPYWGLAAWLLL